MLIPNFKNIISTNINITLGEVIIDSPDGTKHISIDNNNSKIFLQVEDSLKAIARVENQDNTGFDIVLYDGTYFDDDKVKLDCTISPVKVNYLSI